jgi:hypothetical protein
LGSLNPDFNGRRREVWAVTASIGIWAQGDTAGAQVLYRWEANQLIGFVTFEVPTRRFRPSDDNGWPIGGLLYDAVTGDSQGTSPEVDCSLFAKVVASILRGYTRAGKAPTTAHAYYY